LKEREEEQGRRMIIEWTNKQGEEATQEKYGSR
jgi:hypothetical protein